MLNIPQSLKHIIKFSTWVIKISNMRLVRFIILNNPVDKAIYNSDDAFEKNQNFIT
jgi:hypothetical protein